MHNMIKWHGYVVFSSRNRGRRVMDGRECLNEISFDSILRQWINLRNFREIWIIKNGWSIARFVLVQHAFLIQHGQATEKIWVTVTPIVGTSTSNPLLETRHDT